MHIVAAHLVFWNNKSSSFVFRTLIFFILAFKNLIRVIIIPQKEKPFNNTSHSISDMFLNFLFIGTHAKHPVLRFWFILYLLSFMLRFFSKKEDFEDADPKLQPISKKVGRVLTGLFSNIFKKKLYRIQSYTIWTIKTVLE